MLDRSTRFAAARETRSAAPRDASLPRARSQQTAEQIGKGGYGVVYRAMKLSTGEVVAMKRFSLRGIAKDELTGIEVWRWRPTRPAPVSLTACAARQMEINLLRKLHHENIVKYVDTVRTSDHLHIVLE